ncbi:cytosine deaminase [Halomonas icarae]|uniref:Cytosine deaminase n=1 Tax=Halomonas icarae TaxID=2691040 RepID=A0A7X4W2B3_9GAMM|nr:cytosine deaminase [Halomonas icarae]MDR5903533.1 cytosine deaminase [Halomonas icarae]NAW13373.1 cytosine deaminase [Halomonas icarae]
MRIVNARLRGHIDLHEVHIEGDRFSDVTPQMGYQPATEGAIDAQGRLLCAPFIESHIHLDAAMTAGEPRWNESGTLFEGIECWAERKKMLNRDDIRRRALATLELLVGQGVQHVRTHVDVSDPDLVGLKILCELRDELRERLHIQVVAFPQEGLLSYPNGLELMQKAIEVGADVVGAIPHFEYTRELGDASLKETIRLARTHNRLVDVHCDEIDDPNSRFLEVLATEALFADMGSRVTASHTTAMHSYDNAYCSKLFRLLKHSGINFVSCPTESIHLQGRFDTYPKRRGLTRVKELDAAGINVCFAEDSIQDSWYSLGNGRLLRTLDFGLHICQMMGYTDFSRALDFITDNAARTLGIEADYGIVPGRPANCILLDGEDDYDVLRRQQDVLFSIREGRIIMQREPSRVLTPDYLANEFGR